MDNKSNIRVAWLFPSMRLGSYWHPVLSKFTQNFKNTIVYTGEWPGFTTGYEETFTVEVVGKTKRIQTSQSPLGYNPGFDLVSPEIISHLFKFKPQVIFANAFSLWSLLAVLFKSFGGWQIVIAYEGSTPTVDACNSTLRIFLRRIITRFADAFITNNQRGKLYLTNILKAKENLVFVRPFEVPDVKAMSARLGDFEIIRLKSQHPIFLFIGQVIPRKGIHLLLEACVLLKKQNFYDYTLIIIGDGEQRNDLELFTQQHGLQTCVKWLGWLDYSVLSAYFQMADVFVFPTLEDTWGMVVLEAMAFGKPILCSKWAGACEMVVEGENGYVFDPHNPEHLAKLMKYFIENPSLGTSMGYQSKQLISQHTPEAAATFLSEVVDVVLGCPKELLNQV
ncbi:glycosyltransferase [Iningainema tapete]|uniref:Glycosyltransferase family 4 protein n=1 Tax=Iningainema tapete BLCC-T55 TaxID=2748662 RepID=A0A8J7CE57_9CYAN|nr:glycosyltransferase [Iningainema tapete]MBD2773265.1 glycosyltransferase family 4 protein [Iningainema tapete BLCC-T55]